jgi:MYXO-CTERM domain-containing protein
MRALFVALVLAPVLAQAETKSFPSLANDVFEGRVINRNVPRPQALTVSRKLFLNDCKAGGGCVVTKTSFPNDSSLTNRSSIPNLSNGQTTTLQPYMWGDTHWNQVVDCVRETFAPFDIEVVTTQPSGNHHEVMVAGTAEELAYSNAGGVAPFIDCGATADNMLVFVFANQTNGIDYLCGAIAHEAGHAWGLSHNLDADDPMTYLDLGSPKKWQNFNADCGEESPRQCECFDAGGTNSSFKENSFKYLSDQFGMVSTLADTTIELDRPSEGQFVKPSFPISARYESPLELNSGSISIDGQPFAEIPEKNLLFAWSAPADLTPGPHALTISVVDEGDRTATRTVNVNVLASCAGGVACASGTVCFDEVCQPLTDGAGGLGSTCTTNLDCISGSCASDGTDSLCTGACDGNSCPSGFECLSSNLCWPEQSGGCSTTDTDSNAPALLLLALGGLLVVRRRRGSHIVTA